MTNEFAEAMSKRSDSELIGILTRYRNDYQPDAVLAAEIEFSKRNLTLDQLEKAKQDDHKLGYLQKLKADAPLEVYWKILSCIFPGVLNIILGLIFKANGYDKKFRQVVYWTFYGFGFYIAFILTIQLLISIF